MQVTTSTVTAADQGSETGVSQDQAQGQAQAAQDQQQGGALLGALTGGE